MMNCKKLQEKTRYHFPFQPTSEQVEIINYISEFVTTIVIEVSLCLRLCWNRKNYSGCALVKALPQIGKRSVLIAPTGRAAKVLSKIL